MSHIDLAGTLMEFWGFEVPETLEGKSVLSSFRDAAAPTRDAIFMEWGRYEVDHDGFGGFQPIRSVCDGRMKLTVNLMSGDELYDLEQDPGGDDEPDRLVSAQGRAQPSARRTAGLDE